MNRKPLIVVTLVMVVALGIVGVAYGLWFKVLFVEGTIETGNVDAEWTFAGCFDIEDKDVGTTTASIDQDDDQILHFEIENGYPSYTGDCEVEYTYTGSVPVHVEAIRFDPGDFTGCVVDQSPTVGSFTAACDQATVEWVDGLCVQLHEGDRLAASLRVHVEQEAEQNTSYEFGVGVQLNQYNESTCP